MEYYKYILWDIHNGHSYYIIVYAEIRILEVNKDSRRWPDFSMTKLPLAWVGIALTK